MTQYNLLIMLNDPYVKLATLFFNSLYKNTNINNLNKIIVNNIGLSNENKKKLIKKYSKIEFYETNKNIRHFFPFQLINQYIYIYMYHNRKYIY